MITIPSFVYEGLQRRIKRIQEDANITKDDAVKMIKASTKEANQKLYKMWQEMEIDAATYSEFCSLNMRLEQKALEEMSL